METKILKANKANIGYAAALIKKGQIVAFPTETVYGLGANAFSKEAVAKIFKVKSRPADNPLIVHIACLNQLTKIACELNEIEQQLSKKFWPGPLSIVLRAKTTIPKIVTAGLETVAVRMPAHPDARKLINIANLPIAAPSANISAKPSATSANYVMDDFENKIPLIIDGGPSEFGLESTVVRVIDNTINILRPGAITKTMLEEVSPVIVESYKKNGKILSPGTKHPHYNPNAKVILIMGKDHNEIKQKMKLVETDNNKKAFFGFDNIIEDKYFSQIMILSGEDRLFDYARNLYSFFRECDKNKISKIFIHQVSKEGLGYAIMNRIEKAADIIL